MGRYQRISNMAKELNTCSLDNEQKILSNDGCLVYLDKHRIPDVLNLLTAGVVFNHPHNSRGYMINFLEKLKEVKDQYVDCNEFVTPIGPEHPLFDKETIELLFTSSDVVEKGLLPITTCVSICEILGLENAAQLFDHCENEVPKQFFTTVVHVAVKKKTATFHFNKVEFEKQT